MTDLERIDACLTNLGEHFDSVQIFANRHESGEEGGTVKVQKGVGNFYARLGQVVEWMEMNKEDARIEARKDCGLCTNLRIFWK